VLEDQGQYDLATDWKTLKRENDAGRKSLGRKRLATFCSSTCIKEKEQNHSVQ
jgi:hypothetical protein